MPGISEYVGRCFEKMLAETTLKTSFRKIWPVTLISINYLIGMFDVLQYKETALDTQIEYFHQQIANRKKKHDRLRQIEYHQNIYDVFENVVRESPLP